MINFPWKKKNLNQELKLLLGTFPLLVYIGFVFRILTNTGTVLWNIITPIHKKKGITFKVISPI